MSPAFLEPVPLSLSVGITLFLLSIPAGMIAFWGILHTARGDAPPCEAPERPRPALSWAPARKWLGKKLLATLVLQHIFQWII